MEQLQHWELVGFLAVANSVSARCKYIGTYCRPCTYLHVKLICSEQSPPVHNPEEDHESRLTPRSGNAYLTGFFYVIIYYIKGIVIHR